MAQLPKDKKRFYSKVAGSKFIQPDGFEMFFRYGFFDFKPTDYGDEIYMAQGEKGGQDPRNGKTKAQVYFDELEAVVNQRGGNPLFYTQEQVQGLDKAPAPIPTKIPDAAGNLTDVSALGKTEAEIATQDSTLGKGREVGELNQGRTQTGVNESTADSRLQTHFSKAEEIRQKIAAGSGAVQSVSPK